MQRIFLLLLALVSGAFADGTPAPTATVDPSGPVAATPAAASKPDSVAAPGLDTVAAPVLRSAEQIAAEKAEMARDKARRDSLRAAREEAAASMEWHAVSDSGVSTTLQAAPALLSLDAGTPAASGSSAPAATTRSAKARLPIPEVPPEREPRVLMWAGVGLAATGLLAFLIFTGADGSPNQDKVNLDPVTDPTQGNSDAKTEKTMTIRWSH